VATITWWGHATVTVEDSGVRVLTDPLFPRRLGHLRRRNGPPPAPGAARADVAVVSHLHADHLHVPSLAKLEPGTRVLVPAGAERAVPSLRRLRSRGIETTEVRVGDEVGVGNGVVVRTVPAVHDGRRWPVGPQQAQAVGYVVHGRSTTYFAGDTTLFRGLESAVGRCDVALLPVGGWGPYLGPGHLDAELAARALGRIRPRAAVPIHYGTFWPIGLDRVRPHEFHGPGHEFLRHSGLFAPEVAVHVLDHGRSADFDGKVGQ
jgi:L-ascorbate metabolism protein UlaG (beta-lactamase superfamily)